MIPGITLRDILCEFMFITSGWEPAVLDSVVSTVSVRTRNVITLPSLLCDGNLKGGNLRLTSWLILS